VPDPLEISDVIVDYDAESLARRRVTKEAALARLADHGAPRRALRLVERMPERDGALDPDAVDGVLVRSHGEMQRLWEEMLHGDRVARLLRRVVAMLLRDGAARPIRVVDVGCGSGYVVRSLAARGAFADGDVELVGADYNAALVRRASQLARAERLRCEFVVANAFRLESRASIFLSTGVVHHFRGDGLGAFFDAQARCEPDAFIHFDVQATSLAPLGSWLFHTARMREPVAVYDGYLSAVRAHPTGALFAAATSAAQKYAIAHYNRKIPALPMLRTMHGAIGVRRDRADAARAALGGEPVDWLT
jgi:SAM-dependent methyltransferase